MQTQPRTSMPLVQRAAIGILVFILLLLAGMRSAHAVEIIPAVGISQMTDADEQKMFYSVGLRSGLLPRLSTEINVGYRKEETYGGLVDVSTIPVTLSLWASPVPMLYAGGGVGAYFQTLSYDNSLLIPNESETQWGAHLGGGLKFPLAPMVGLDFSGRYVFLEEKANALPSGALDPSFWSASAGLSIGF